MVSQMTLQEALAYLNFISQKKNRTAYENQMMMIAFRIVSSSAFKPR